MNVIEQKIGRFIVIGLLLLVMVLGIQIITIFTSQDRMLMAVEAADIVYTNEELTIFADELIKHQENFIDKTYPVGRIYISTSNTNPGTIFGGTWEAFGTGRTLVGVDTGQTDFSTVEKTGGAKVVTHNHGNGASQNGTLSAAIGSTNSNPINLGFKAANYFSGFGTAMYSLHYSGVHRGGSFNHFTQVWGNTADTAVTVLQPYITVYMWKRTA